jgi:hypothetical protein
MGEFVIRIEIVKRAIEITSYESTDTVALKRRDRGLSQNRQLEEGKVAEKLFSVTANYGERRNHFTHFNYNF